MPAKINRPESERSHGESCEGGGSVRGENPSLFSILSAHQGFVLDVFPTLQTFKV